MTITISRCNIGFRFTSTHKAFREKFPEGLYTPVKGLYKMMEDLSDWANNDLKIECLFDVV